MQRVQCYKDTLKNNMLQNSHCKRHTDTTTQTPPFQELKCMCQTPPFQKTQMHVAFFSPNLLHQLLCELQLVQTLNTASQITLCCLAHCTEPSHYTGSLTKHTLTIWAAIIWVRVENSSCLIAASLTVIVKSRSALLNFISGGPCNQDSCPCWPKRGWCPWVKRRWCCWWCSTGLNPPCLLGGCKVMTFWSHQERCPNCSFTWWHCDQHCTGTERSQQHNWATPVKHVSHPHKINSENTTFTPHWKLWSWWPTTEKIQASQLTLQRAHCALIQRHTDQNTPWPSTETNASFRTPHSKLCSLCPSTEQIEESHITQSQ